jgi:hypothetical protein
MDPKEFCRNVRIKKVPYPTTLPCYWARMFAFNVCMTSYTDHNLLRHILIISLYPHPRSENWSNCWRRLQYRKPPWCLMYTTFYTGKPFSKHTIWLCSGATLLMFYVFGVLLLLSLICILLLSLNWGCSPDIVDLTDILYILTFQVIERWVTGTQLFLWAPKQRLLVIGELSASSLTRSERINFNWNLQLLYKCSPALN